MDLVPATTPRLALSLLLTMPPPRGPMDPMPQMDPRNVDVSHRNRMDFARRNMVDADAARELELLRDDHCRNVMGEGDLRIGWDLGVGMW